MNEQSQRRKAKIMTNETINPIRVQLSRKKGWRMPENTVSVSHPGKFGNPFKVDECRNLFDGSDRGIAQRCVDAFKVWAFTDHWHVNWSGEESQQARKKLLAALPTLRGKNLACWCELDMPCHADVLLEMANRDDLLGDTPC